VVKRITSIICYDKIASSILAEGTLLFASSFFVAPECHLRSIVPTRTHGQVALSIGLSFWKLVVNAYLLILLYNTTNAMYERTDGTCKAGDYIQIQQIISIYTCAMLYYFNIFS
jgi:hypothetical protein